MGEAKRRDDADGNNNNNNDDDEKGGGAALVLDASVRVRVKKSKRTRLMLRDALDACGWTDEVRRCCKRT